MEDDLHLHGETVDSKLKFDAYDAHMRREVSSQVAFLMRMKMILPLDTSYEPLSGYQFWSFELVRRNMAFLQQSAHQMN